MIQLKAMWEPGQESLMKGKDPQRIANEIYSISDEPTKKQIVDKARDESTELHGLFEWNNDIAAEKYREEQAGFILRKLKVTFIQTDDEKEPIQTKVPVRMFYGNPVESSGFVSIVKIMGNGEMYNALLERAKAELKSFKNKYAMLKELEAIFEMIDELN